MELRHDSLELYYRDRVPGSDLRITLLNQRLKRDWFLAFPPQLCAEVQDNLFEHSVEDPRFKRAADFSYLGLILQAIVYLLNQTKCRFSVNEYTSVRAWRLQQASPQFLLQKTCVNLGKNWQWPVSSLLICESKDWYRDTPLNWMYLTSRTPLCLYL